MHRNTANFAARAAMAAANFGVAVAVNPDGGTTFIGVEGWDGNVTDGGSAFITA